VVVLAGFAYVPTFFSSPGALAADTKTYLYLSPGRLLSRAVGMWDPTVAAGTVPHQNIGYLFPMGPYYWLLAHLGVATWIAQRLWWGTTFFGAGLGVLALIHLLDPDRRDVSRTGAFVAALTYQLSPYVLPYVPRHSVLLGAWAALPWFIVLAARSLREGGWRWPAAFALVLLLVGSINASSLLFAALGPVLWVIYDAGILRTVTWRRVWATALRVGALSLGVSLWWIVGLSIQGRFGIDVLRYTETPATVAGTSTAVETLRQMGYWYFYGRELYVPFTPQAHAYMTDPLLIAVGFAVPVMALIGAALSRWRHRAFLASMILVGLFVSVGAHRWGPPSLWQLFWDRFSTTSSGLALRSTPRAVPLVSLGLACLVGAGVTSLGRLVPRAKVAAVALTMVVAVVNLGPLFTGGLVATTQRQPEQVPSYWSQAATSLSAAGDATRVLTLPGNDFSAYRWGFTLEPVLPGLTDRPSLQREAVPYGGLGTVDLLMALDRRLQEGILDPASVVPVARLLGVGDILQQNDLAYERYPTARPEALDAFFAAVPGLGPAVGFGAPVPNVPAKGPLLDAPTLGRAPGTPVPAPLVVHPVTHPVPIVRAEQGPPVVLAGDGEGVVDAAAVGLLDRAGPLLYSGSLDQAQVAAQMAQGADLVVTDSYRDRALQWGGLRDNHGPTRVPGQQPLTSDQTDVPLELFPKDPTTRSHAVITGVASVQATHEGQPLYDTPEDRAVNAIDGDPVTDWRVIRFKKPIGEKLVIHLQHPVTTDHVSLLQTITSPRSPITKVQLHFDDQAPLDVALTGDSLAAPGQTVTFPTRTFSTFELEIRGTQSSSDLGFAEVSIPGVKAEELISLPTDLLTKAGTASLTQRLFVLVNRERISASDPNRTDEEHSIRRIVTLATDRSFSVGAQVHLAPSAPDDLVDRVLGFADAQHGGATFTSSGHLNGSFDARARSAFDGDPSTAWTAPMQGPPPWLRAQLAQPVTFDHLDVDLVADGRHSVPTELTLDAGGQRRVVAVPAVADDPSRPGATAHVRVSFPALTTNDVTVTVTATRAVTTIPNGGKDPVPLPVAVAELGIPGVRSAAAPATIPATCRADLVSVDGSPVPLQVRGSVADALAGRDLQVTPCATPGLTLSAGQHVIRTATGAAAGLDVDRLLLASDRGGSALALAPGGKVAPVAGGAPPVVTVRHDGTTSMDLAVGGAAGPFWLVLGQSENAGWRASFTGATARPGPVLVDGYANGWYVTPTGNGPITVHLDWTPQLEVWIGLAVSAGVSALCLGIVVRRRSNVHDVAVRPAGNGPRLGRVESLSLGWIAVVTVGSVLVVPPAASVLLGLILVVTRRWRVGAALPAVLMAVAGLGVVAGQVVKHPEAGYGWPGLFGRLDGLVWVAVALLAVQTFTAPPRAPDPGPYPGPYPSPDRDDR